MHPITQPNLSENISAAGVIRLFEDSIELADEELRKKTARFIIKNYLQVKKVFDN